MTEEFFASVWDAVEETPGQAVSMRLRSDMMVALSEHIDRAGLTQAQAAKILGVSQPRISDLKRGKVSLFSLDALVDMLATIGIGIRLEIEPGRQDVAKKMEHA